MVIHRSVAVLCCMILLASCAGAASRTESFPAPSSPESESPPLADTGFYEFRASRLGGGGQVTGAELHGKDVAMWFWAPW